MISQRNLFASPSSGNGMAFGRKINTSAPRINNNKSKEAAIFPGQKKRIALPLIITDKMMTRPTEFE
jgi:hypothetical protein